MTPNDMIPLISAALRDVLQETPDAPADSPEDVYQDLACRLVLRLVKQGLTIVPTKPERIFAQMQGEAAKRIFAILTQWLAEYPRKRSFVTRAVVPGKFEIVMTDSNTTAAFFTGGSVQDAYAQAAQTVHLDRNLEAAQ